jgi:serine/threonine protein kinase
MDAELAEVDALKRLPVRFRRDPAELARIDAERGTMRAKHPRAYYLDGLKSVFQLGVCLPGILRVDQEFSGAEVVLLNPGPNAIEVLGILDRFPGIKYLHIIESGEKNIDAIRSGLQKEAGGRSLPEMAGYVTDIRHLPEELAGRCDLVVEINVVDPKTDKVFRQDVVRQISRVLKLGGLFYSAGVTVRWTDKVIPLSLVSVPVRAKILKQVGYSDALPRPVFYLKHSPDVPLLMTEEGRWRSWWRKGLAMVSQGTKGVDGAAVEAPLVPRVEDGRGEPNTTPWDFLITKPAVRRPAMDWMPRDGDRFGNRTLGSLLQFNRETGMYVFRVRECPEVVLKIMKPFEGDIPDDPLEWNSLRKSKTLKRENQALNLLKGLGFIPQRIAHGYDPATGWYAIVVEYEKSRSFRNFIDQHYNRLHRHHETDADVENAVEPVLMILNSLAIVHDKGLVHQDLKPEHVFLRPASPEAVLIDWGLARKIDEPLSEERRSISWLHAPPERSDINVLTSASTHQDLYAVGVMLFQLATDLNLDERPRFLVDHFFRHGRMPSAAELELMLRPHWKWAAPVIARAISSRKDVPGYADNRYANSRDMARDIVRSYGKPLASFDSEKSSTVPGH